MKYRVPNLNGSSAPTSSTTFKHLDAVFSALSLLAGYIGLSNVSLFLTALQISYQRVCYMVNIDAKTTITELKRVRLAYVEWIRGGPEPKAMLNKDLTLADIIRDVNAEFPPVKAKTSTGEQVVFTPTNTDTVDTLLDENLLNVLPIQAIVDYRNSLVSPDANLLWFMDTIVIAFLDLNRVIVMPKSPDYSTITGENNSAYAVEVHKWGTKESSKYGPMGENEAPMSHNIPGAVEGFLASNGTSKAKMTLAYRAKTRAQRYFIISTAGPNGESTWSAFSDAVAILQNMHLAKALNNFCKVSGLKRFMAGLVRCFQLRNVDTVLHDRLRTGKIITFAEWGGKTRIVAALDYWTQVMMTPLHDTLFDLLRTLNSDATFDQDSASNKIRLWTADPKSELYSFDLTAATDRLPISLQGRILNSLLDLKDIGHYWVNIFSLRSYYTEDDQPIKYAVGAPMGSKSNWAMLALTHHIIVYYAASRVNIKNFKSYCICGDDIVINSKVVAESYREVMEYLGLSINQSKSILAAPGRSAAAEFCKRIFINGREYTCFPTKLIAKTVMNGRLLPQLQSELVKRGVIMNGHDLFDWLGALVDAQSHSFLAMLNLLPSAVTGLKSTIPLPSETPQLDSWWKPLYELTPNDMVQAYTYVASVEQLKRLDALLRQTVTVSEAISNATADNYGIRFTQLEWAKEITNKPFLDLLLNYRTDLNLAHPIVEASQLEAIRVSLLLTKISNGEMSVESAARAKLLDMFRNALASMWDDADAAKAQADRSLITKALDTIETMLDITVDSLTKAETKANDNVAIYTTKLQHFDRNWTIRWALGGNVTINTVKSRIAGSTDVAKKGSLEHIKLLPVRKSTRI